MTVREQLEARLCARGWSATLAPPRRAGRAAAGDEPLAPPPGAITEWVPEPGAGSLTGGVLRQVAACSGRIGWADPCDRFDPASAARAGVALDRLLWLRGAPSLRGIEGLSRWNEILNLLIQSHAVELVVADFLDWPLAELRRIPRSAWFRLLRGLEHGRQTALLLLAPAPLSGTCARAVRRGPPRLLPRSVLPPDPPQERLA